MLDLNVRPDTFRREIYSANQKSSGNVAFAALVSHQAHIKTTEHKDNASNDAALATLKQSLASMAKEKEARRWVMTKRRRRQQQQQQCRLLQNRHPDPLPAPSYVNANREQ